MMICWWPVILCIIPSLQAAQQDLWVAVGSHLETGPEGNIEAVTVNGAEYIAGVSNVETANNESVVFVTDVAVGGAAIYKVTRSNNQNKVSVIHSDPDIGYYDGIIYDDFANTILFTSPTKHAIYEQELNSNPSRIVLLENKEKKPSGITQERCSRDIYWTNRDRAHPSIERTISHRGHTYSLFTANLTLPRAITTDPWTNKLYWTDQVGYDFRLERSDLDGVNRELICTIKSQTPYSLAVDEDSFYWSDWSNHAIWKLPKEGGCKPQLVRAVKSAKPNGLAVAIKNYPECDQHKKITSSTTSSSSLETKSASIPTSSSTLVTKSATTSPSTLGTKSTSISKSASTLDTKSTSIPTLVTKSPAPAPLCLNSGSYIAGFGCDCQEGYSGPHCSVFACHNYCLNLAKCFIVSEEPVCQCHNGTSGDRCEHVSIETVDVDDDETLVYVVIGVGVVCVLLVLVVLGLTVNTIKMKKQPRLVRKRFISGSNNKKMKVPSGEVHDDGSGVSFDIENCCNMTLCDTPCFEPPSRAPKASKCHRSEDKKQLLNNSNDDLY